MSNEENLKIVIEGQEFEVLDAKEKMTIPDCIVAKNNKLGRGHGEAKIYIGRRTADNLAFFDDFSRKCIILKKDLIEYLQDVKDEYENPLQEYRGKIKLKDDWVKHSAEALSLDKEINYFNLEDQDQIKGDRFYLNSEDPIYKFIRKVSLPKITYFSILKIKDKEGELFYFFRLFLDYETKRTHLASKENKEDAEIDKNKALTKDEINVVKKARVGQGKYRQELLDDCIFCPFTLVAEPELLIASHIKPWVKSDIKEKTDPQNGFMFTPTYDKLFDKGFITFSNDKKLKISPFLSKINRVRLRLRDGEPINKLPIEGRESYMEYHRKHVFRSAGE